MVWLLDSRREPSVDDRAIQELFAGRETPVLAALTKSDKLPRGEHACLAPGEELLHRAIVIGGVAADVEQPKHACEAGPFDDVSDEVPERGSVGPCRSGIAVSGEIEKIKGAVRGARWLPMRIGRLALRGGNRVPRTAHQGYFVNVQHPRLAGRPGHFGYASPREGIEQARFAYVGPANQGDFGESGCEGNVG